MKLIKNEFSVMKKNYNFIKSTVIWNRKCNKVNQNCIKCDGEFWLKTLIKWLQKKYIFN